MSLVGTLKGMLRAEERIVYRCDACGATFRVEPGAESLACSKCDSPEVRRISRV